MALVPPAVASALLANMAGNLILGISAAQLAAAVSTGWCSYMLSAPVVSTADVGTLGAGAGLGFAPVLSPTQLSQSFRSTFTSHGINGNHRDMLINALSVGLCQSLLAAQIVTVAAGTGVGTGSVVSVLPVPAVSIPAMIAAFAGAAIVGPSAPGLASAIAEGFDQVLPSLRCQLVIAGPPSPFPGGGSGLGKVI